MYGEQPSIPPVPSPGKDLYIEIKDSDPRAVAYVAGRAPNRWGTMADGSKVRVDVPEAEAAAMLVPVA